MDHQDLVRVVLAQQEQFAWISQNLMTKAEGRQLADALGLLASKVEKLREEQAAVTAWLKQHDVQIERLERLLGQ